MLALDFLHRPQHLLPGAALLALCLTPAFGSLALVITLIAMLVSLPVAVARRGWAEGGGKRWVWGAVFAYFTYFVLADALLRGDIGASLYTMTPNLPLIAVALIALALDPARATLAPARIGHWASVAVVLSFGMALLIWQAQPGWLVLGLSLTEASGVNDRLMLLAGNALPFAATYMTLGFMALLGWHERTPLSRGLSLVALLVSLGTVVVWSQSRGATLTAVPLLVVAIWYLRPSPKQLIAGLAGVAILIGLAMTLGGYGDKIAAVTTRLTQGVATFFSGDAAMEFSTGARLIMYRAGLDAFADSPIWGYGVTQRFAAVLPYLPEGLSMGFSHLHNSFLTHAVAGGLMGVLILLGLLLTPFMINHSGTAQTALGKRDLQYSAGVIFLSLIGIGMTNLILNHDVSAHFLALLMLTHLAMHHHHLAPPEV